MSSQQKGCQDTIVGYVLDKAMTTNIHNIYPIHPNIFVKHEHIGGGGPFLCVLLLLPLKIEYFTFVTVAFSGTWVY